VDNDHPRVTVIIPCYNEAGLLPDAVESARSQTIGPPHVVVVDDGSTDDTANVVATLGVTYVARRNGGPAAARNTGLSYVKTDYVVFLDADDMLHPRHNESCLEALNTNPEAAYAYTQWEEFGAANERSGFRPFDADALLAQNYIHMSSLFHARALRDVNFDERLRSGMEDWDLYLSLLRRGRPGVLVDEPLLLYRVRHGRTHTLRTRPLKYHLICIYVTLKHRRLYGVRRTLKRLYEISALIWECIFWASPLKKVARRRAKASPPASPDGSTSTMR